MALRPSLGSASPPLVPPLLQRKRRAGVRLERGWARAACSAPASHAALVSRQVRRGHAREPGPGRVRLTGAGGQAYACECLKTDGGRAEDPSSRPREEVQVEPNVERQVTGSREGGGANTAESYYLPGTLQRLTTVH